jgi:hypothetical protein
MPVYQIAIDDLSIDSLEHLLQDIPKDKLYIGNDVGGELVKFSDFVSIYENNLDKLIAMFEDIILNYDLKESEAEYISVINCINLCRSNDLDEQTILLKIIVFYTKYMDTESYLRPQNKYWECIGSRIYPWFAVDGAYTWKFSNIRLIECEY